MKESIPTKHKHSAGIYSIENLLNGKKYIGSTTAFRKRYTNHYFELSKGVHPSKHMQSAYTKYGSNNFHFSLIEVLDKKIKDFKKVLLKTENDYILNLKVNNRQYGYNLRISAESNFGITHSKDAKTRIKGRKLSESTKAKMSLGRIGEKHHSVKLTTQLVKEIKILLHKGYRNTHISEYFGLHKSYINDIKNNGSWDSVNVHHEEIEQYDTSKIDSINSTRLTNYDVTLIKFLLHKGKPNFLIAEYFGIPNKKVSEIKSGKTYRQIVLSEEQIEEYESTFDWDNLNEIKQKIETRKSKIRKDAAMRGSSNTSSILKEPDVQIIKDMILNGFTNNEIAELFEVGHHSISKIRTGDNWGHLTKFEKRTLGRPSGSKHHNFKHSDVTVLEVIKLHKAGLSTKEICEKLNLEKTFVNRVKSGKTRRNITGINN